MDIRDLQWGAFLLRLNPRERHLQFFGAVHGGVIASTVDAAAFWVASPEVEKWMGPTNVETKLNDLPIVQ